MQKISISGFPDKIEVGQVGHDKIEESSSNKQITRLFRLRFTTPFSPMSSLLLLARDDKRTFASATIISYDKVEYKSGLKDETGKDVMLRRNYAHQQSRYSLTIFDFTVVGWEPDTKYFSLISLEAQGFHFRDGVDPRYAN